MDEHAVVSWKSDLQSMCLVGGTNGQRLIILGLEVAD